MKTAEDVSEGNDTEAEYSSFLEDYELDGNNEIEDPDYDVNTDPLTKTLWGRDMFWRRKKWLFQTLLCHFHVYCLANIVNY